MVGIDTYDDGVGYKHIKIKPHIGGGFTFASASLDTYYGKVSNSWKVQNDSLKMDVEIPANTTATVYIPANDANSIKESGRSLSQINGLKVTGKEDNYIVVEVGSGVYHFAVLKSSDTNGK
jgi:alpha-L-rhamnosidase